MKFDEKLINLMNESFNTQAQNLIAKDFQNYVEETNPFDRTNYKSLIEEVLEFGAFPESTNVMTREAIQNCFINVLQKKGVDPFEESYRTRMAKQKLERLKNELHEQTNKVFEHWKQTNGQPMNVSEMTEEEKEEWVKKIDKKIMNDYLVPIVVSLITTLTLLSFFYGNR